MEKDLEIELDVDQEEVGNAMRCALMGKIITNRVLSKRGVIGILQSIWSPKDLIEVREIGNNVYGLLFSNEEVTEMVLERGPWTVMGHCICFKKWEIEKTLMEMEFREVIFWVQIHNLPWEVQTKRNAERVGNVMGRIVEIEDVQWGKAIGRGFLRLRVAMDVERSLLGGFWLPRKNGHKIWAEIRYEKLGDFCYKCGKLGHIEKTCDKEEVIEAGKKMYGPWMRTGMIRTLKVDSGRFKERAVPKLSPSKPTIEDETSRKEAKVNVLLPGCLTISPKPADKENELQVAMETETLSMDACPSSVNKSKETSHYEEGGRSNTGSSKRALSMNIECGSSCGGRVLYSIESLLNIRKNIEASHSSNPNTHTPLHHLPNLNQPHTTGKKNIKPTQTVSQLHRKPNQSQIPTLKETNLIKSKKQKQQENEALYYVEFPNEKIDNVEREEEEVFAQEKANQEVNVSNIVCQADEA
ncbi:hypothetical protein CCACVL1_04733 [Corchorus capsularis]|uniref:CCHC-type domain-containing protein n=1 Tax=Corchorus capsularis TaxID=210143 RepID=A0A1R3JQ45_COCAP|nr:hypothetical protein CCACVL1_04733 [Corchorus capsularis]